MKTKNSFTPLITLLLSSFMLIGCSNGNTSSSSSASSSSSSTSESSEEGYNENWKPGPFAIQGAVQPAIKNPQGVTTDLGKMRASQNKRGLPQKGEANLLVVPVEFLGDSEYGYGYSTESYNSLNNSFFGDDETAGISVSKYYKKSSYGALELSGVTTPVVSLPSDFYTYLGKAINFGIASVVQEITDYVYKYLFVTTKTYYDKDFDANHDGYVDGIVLAYSWYPCEAYYGSEMYDYFVYLYNNQTYFGSEISLTTKVNSVAWTSGIMSEVTKVSNDAHVANKLVGKMIGLDDYVDTTGDTNGDYRAPLAHNDVMDGYMGDHNPFSKYQLGWIDPTKIFADNAENEKTYTLRPYESSGDALLLSPEETGLFGEYLLVDYYTPTDLYEQDSVSGYLYNLYGTKCYDEAGVRVYKVDARLVEGTKADNVEMLYGNPDFAKANAYFDYAFSNNGYNKYSDLGIFEDYPLVTELSKKGFNRHMVDSFSYLTNDDMLKQGDAFGNEDDVDGFYINYSFNGNGGGNEKLNLTFSVDAITTEAATITVRRAK